MKCRYVEWIARKIEADVKNRKDSDESKKASTYTVLGWGTSEVTLGMDGWDG